MSNEETELSPEELEELQVERPGRRRPPRVFLLVWGLALVLLIAAIILLVSQVAPQAQANDPEIKQVVQTAFEAPVRFVVLPNTPSSFSDAQLAFSPKALVANPSDIATATDTARSKFNQIYSPDCTNCQAIVNTTMGTITGQSSGRFRALDWNVRDLQWLNIDVNGETATVRMSGTSSSKVQYVSQGKGSIVNPVQGLVKVYTLKKVDGHWQIINEVNDDAAASKLPINQGKSSGQGGSVPTNGNK